MPPVVVTARIIQQGLQEAEEFDQPLVIINQPGGIGTIGSREVKNSQPDGYKILCHHNAIITAKLAETVNYGPVAFEPIALTGEMSMVVLVRADSQIEDLQGLLEESARSESSIRFAANKGAPSYYAALQLEQSLQEPISPLFLRRWSGSIHENHRWPFGCRDFSLRVPRFPSTRGNTG